LTNVLKKKVDDAAKLVADTQADFDYFTQQRDWLTDNFPDGVYRDVIGLCKAASIEEIREQDYSLNPGRYVGFLLMLKIKMTLYLPWVI
jgi:type I restriction enzyme M protein